MAVPDREDIHGPWIGAPGMPLDLNGPRGVQFVPLRRTLGGQPLRAWLAAAADLHAGRIAIDDGERSLTYAELWTSACGMAQLIARTTPPGRPVAIILPNVAHYPIAWIGCLLAGRPAALLDSHYPAERNRQCLEDIRPAAIVGRRDDVEAQQLAGELPYLALEAAAGERRVVSPPDQATPDSEPAFIIFTSGSTGRPKGVAISAAAALNRAVTLIDSVHMNPNDVVLSAIPPSALGGIINLLETFLAGATLLKLDLPRTYLSAHEGKAITMLFATPAMLRVITRLDVDGTIRRGLRVVQPVGDSLLLADLRQLRSDMPAGCAVLNAYGSSEALASLQWFLPDPYPLAGPKVASGYPVPGYDCTLLDEHGCAVAVGQAGELVLRSRYMSLGEWREGRLCPGPFRPDRRDRTRSIHWTGDIAVAMPDGLFTVIGRRDRMVKIRGNRIEPAEIEEALLGLPEVVEAAVAARPRDGNPELVAFIVPVRPPTAALRKQISIAVAAALPTYMQPARFVFLTELPLLPGGKVDLAALLRRDV